jgi:hypothetical protein
MIDNIAPFKRLAQQEPYPDLWPRATYDSVLHALHRNQPLDRSPTDTYIFAVKSDIVPSPTCSVIVQANNNVLYQTPKRKTDAEAFVRWFNRNAIPLRKLSDDGFTGTIVGKMGHVDGTDFFCVYYIIGKKDVYLDEPSLGRLLRSKEDLFNGTLLIMPTLRTATVTIDKAAGEVSAKDLQGGLGLSGAVVAFPVVYLENRTSESGAESAPPRLLSTAIHMRYMAFQHVIGPGPRRIRIDDAS